MSYASTTEVPADRSRGEIEKTLMRYGADQFMYGWNDQGAVIQFRANGERVGYLCTIGAWQRTFHTIADKS